MTPENFCYWLQGYFELNGNHPISLAQSVIINEHLNLVFKKNTNTALVNDNRNLPLYLTNSSLDSKFQGDILNDFKDYPMVQYSEVAHSC